jgi:glucokinase
MRTTLKESLEIQVKQKIGIGIDLGGSSIKYALGTEEGEILKTGNRPSRATEKYQIIIKEVSEAIFEMLGYADSIGVQVSAIGMGTPGAVDVTTGYLKGFTPNFRHWHNVPVKRELEKKVKRPVFVDNDANLMAFGEAKFGAGIGYQNIICLTIGTGIGGGIIINGDLFRGSNFAGAELGHTTIKYNGLKCRCGGKGCLERYASATAMIDQYSKMSRHQKSTKKEKINVKYIFEQSKLGDPIANEVIDNSTYYLGRGLANFINIFNPNSIIIGGGVADAGKAYLKKIENVAFRYAMDCAKEKVTIVGANLGNRAGYMGALKFALDQTK